jgi:hypothetical protein
MNQRLYESGGAKPQSKGNGVFDVCIIKPGWGSSGYYSRELLESATTAQTFRPGRPSFANHPTEAEFANGRDITKIMGRIVSEPEFRESEDGSDDGLWASLKVRDEWIDFVEEYKDTIGLSIFADGKLVEGEAEGRRGRIVESFNPNDPYTSVDFVVAAGAGGKVDRMLESFKAIEALSDDRRSQLSTLVHDAHGAEKKYVWVRDFDENENVVYFDVNTDGDYGIFRQSYSVSDDVAVELLGEPEEVRVETTYVNVRQTTESANAEEHKENGMALEADDIKAVAEAAAAAVIEALKPAAPAEVETDSPDVAAVAEAVATSGLPKSARERVYEGLKVEGADVNALIESEKKYIEELKVDAPSEDPGRVREGSAATTDFRVSGW